MYSLRSNLLYHISQNMTLCYINRWSSSSNKAATKKYLNFVNKSLYGAVTRKSKPQMAPKECPAEVANPEDVNKQIHADYRSEMYWMLEHKPENTLPKVQRPNKITTKKMLKTFETVTAVGSMAKKTKDSQLDAKITCVHMENKKSPKTDKTLRNTLGNLKIEAETPTVLMQFNDSLCKPPLKQASNKSIPKLGSSDDRLRDILTVPPFDLSNWRLDVDDVVLGPNKMEVRQMPSVGKVLQATMSESSRKALMQWKLLKIAELGQQGFDDLQKSHLTAGSSFHSAIQTYFHTGQVMEPKSKIWSSVETVMTDIDPDTELVESPIVHPVLQYKGVVDCVSRVDGQLSVIEWKKSDRQKTTIASTYDAPIQLCAYLGAINADPRYTMEVRNGLVVVAYTTGGPAHAFRMDETNVQKYWRSWLKRLHEYWVRHRDGTLPEPI